MRPCVPPRGRLPHLGPYFGRPHLAPWHQASKMFSIFWGAKHVGCLGLLGLLMTLSEAGRQQHAGEKPQELERGGRG